MVWYRECRHLLAVVTPGLDLGLACPRALRLVLCIAAAEGVVGDRGHRMHHGRHGSRALGVGLTEAKWDAVVVVDVGCSWCGQHQLLAHPHSTQQSVRPRGDCPLAGWEREKQGSSSFVKCQVEADRDVPGWRQPRQFGRWGELCGRRVRDWTGRGPAVFRRACGVWALAERRDSEAGGGDRRSKLKRN